MCSSDLNCKLLSNTGEVYSGGFLITSFESSGEYNKAELVAITLESSGTTSLIDNDFRLLEDGGFRLLEYSYLFLLMLLFLCFLYF